MKTIFRWTLIVAVILVTSNIAGANSTWVVLRFWPFGEIMVVPLWVVLLGGVCIGMVLGGIVFWWRVLVSEVRLFKIQRELKRIKQNTQAMHDTQPTPDASQSPSVRQKISQKISGA